MSEKVKRIVKVIAKCDTCNKKFNFCGWNAKRLEEGEWMYCPASECDGKIRKATDQGE